MGHMQPVREMPIQRALEWAFGTEYASLDFEEEAGRAPVRYARGTEAVLMERGALGCSVDETRGRSWPADDADVIASYVAALPVSKGGRRMAAWVAEYARAGRTPDAMVDATPRLVPVEWHSNPHGTFGKPKPTGQTYTRRTRRGFVTEDILWVPCMWEPSPATIAAARRHYLDWYGALLDIGHRLSTTGNLRTVVIGRAMPQLRPWAIRA